MGEAETMEERKFLFTAGPLTWQLTQEKPEKSQVFLRNVRVGLLDKQ